MARKPQTEIKVGLDARQAQTELRKLSDDFRQKGAEIDRVFGTRVGGALDSVSSKVAGIQTLSGGMGGLGTAATAAAVGVAAVGAAAAAAAIRVNDMVRAQQEAIAATAQLAENLGVSVFQFSALEQLARRYGATAEDVADVIKDLSVRAIENEKEFTELGISIRDVNGDLLTGIPLFERVADGISAMKNETKQAAAADILASDAGVRLIEVLRLSRDERERLTSAIKSNGEAIDAQTRLINEDYLSAMRDADQATEALWRTITTKLAPGFADVAREVANIARNMNRFVRNGSLIQAEPIFEDQGPPAPLQPADGVPPSLARPANQEETTGAGILERRGGGRRRRPRGGGGGQPDPIEELTGFERLAMEREAYNAMRDAHMAHGEAIVEQEVETQRRLNEVVEEGAQYRAETQMHAASVIVGAIGSAANSIGQIEENLAGESAQRSEELFYVQQAISAVQAGINTALAITRALAELGPIAGPIAAVAIGAAGAAQVAAILTASPRGAPPQASGGGSIPRVPTTRVDRAPGPRFGPSDAANDAGGPTVINVTFNGPTDSRRAARELRDVMGGS